jgi:hypothetical protein
MKPKYEKPLFIELGETWPNATGNCISGYNATNDAGAVTCNAGYDAQGPTCNNGTSAQKNCLTGNQEGHCTTGSKPG